ncbi:MAG TPA: Xaa-Pro peptidase family protein, partial [Gemmatimonadales bacterium]
MTDRRPERLEALRRGIAEAKLDALVVSSLPNIRYLTGFSGSSALVLVTADAVVFLSDSRYQVQSRDEIGDLARIVIEGGGMWERLKKLLPDHPGVSRIGYEAHHLTAREAERLAAAEPAFSGTANLVETLREVKSPEEVAAIREAGTIATDALAVATAQVRAGQTEFEVAALLESALRRGGSEWYAFPTIIASGPRSALPHAHTSGRMIEPGDFLLIDFGAVLNGYCSDVTRTFVVGAPATPEQRAVYVLVQEAQQAAFSGLRAGLSGREGDALARHVITEGGHGEHFGHSLGHGLGLEVHEAPRLAKTVDQPLPAGAVVTVEPGIYLEGWGGVRIEDDVLLDEKGAELLTEYERDLVRL